MKMCKNYPKSHIEVIKTQENYVKMVKMHDFSSSGIDISRFCTNSEEKKFNHQTVTFKSSGSNKHEVLKIRLWFCLFVVCSCERFSCPLSALIFRVSRRYCVSNILRYSSSNICHFTGNRKKNFHRGIKYSCLLYDCFL